MSSCKDKVAVVTGAAGQGIGRSTALTLAREGARVVVNYRNDDSQVGAILEYIRSRGGQAIAVKADVSKPDGCQELIAAAGEQFGPVEILINSVGGGWKIRDYTEMEPEEWQGVLRGEVDTTLMLMKRVVPAMRERKWGRIVHLGMAGILHFHTMRGVAPDYCLGKAARVWMTRAMGYQERKHGITVNCVSPEIVGHYNSLAEAVDHCEHGSTWAGRQRLTPQDVAETIAFLCSDNARFLCGTDLVLDNP